MIIGLATLFAALALINTAAMSTAERRAELATIRLLGGTPGQAARTIALELLPTVLVALAAGAVVVAISVHGIPDGLTGIPLAIPRPSWPQSPPEPPPSASSRPSPRLKRT